MVFNLKIKMFEKIAFIVNEIFQKIRIAFQFYFLKRIQNFAEKTWKITRYTPKIGQIIHLRRDVDYINNIETVSESEA